MGNYRHGYYGSPTYKSWSEMKWRCDHSVKNYKWISYCEAWKDFKNFLADMGERPAGMTLDRIDPFGDYCPENCRWADIETQANNKTNSVKYFYGGELLSLYQIARKYDISRSNLANKIYIDKVNIKEAVEYLRSKKGGMTYGRT